MSASITSITDLNRAYVGTVIMSQAGYGHVYQKVRTNTWRQMSKVENVDKYSIPLPATVLWEFTP